MVQYVTIPMPLGRPADAAAHMAGMTAAITDAVSRADTTSSLQRYLAEITDPVLRENLSREISGLQRQFGLVFERHHPEGIRLPKHAVKRGAKVVVTARKDSVFYRVHKLDRDNGTATIVDAEGHLFEHRIEELTVAKEFGDVMYPGLRGLSEIRRGDPAAPVHTMINGENYHALEALQYTHAGKVDLIYIDPPYNTGAADWKYNDRYVDAKDGYRHSKWLSFMEKRLLIAKALLKPTGVIVMSIDDNEYARLKTLSDQVFGDRNFVSSFIWKGRSGGQGNKGYNRVHEHALAYAKDIEKFVPGRDAGVDKDFPLELPDGRRYKRQLLRKWGGTSLRSDRPNQFYALVAPDGTDVYPLHSDGAEGHWRWARPTMAKNMADDRVEFVRKDDSWIAYERVFDSKNEAGVAFTTILPESVKATAAGSKLLSDILGRKSFSFPKPIELIEHLIKIMGAPQGAVILDFFGGSGTTAEAVIRLNAEDGGNRQAILVTNNELSKADDTRLRTAGHKPGDDEYEALGVFHHVTKPRLETVVTGVREDGSKYSEGLDANIAFFELTYLDEPEIVTGRAFNDLAGLFWLKAGGVGGTVELTAGAKADGFAISESGRTAVLFTPGRAKALAEKLAATEQDITHLFIVTDSEAQGDEAATHFPGGITVERIYGSYMEAFQVNRKD